MSGGVCYRAGYEKGAWFELVSVREVIVSKESRGKSAAFERMLYKSWLNNPEYAKADKDNQIKGFYGELAGVKNKRECVIKIKFDVNHIPSSYATSPEAIVSKPRRGRVPKPPGQVVHRTTEWRRRKKEKQGALPL